MSTDSPVAGPAVAPAAGATAFRLGLLAGRGVAGTIGDGGPATLAQLDEPAGVAVDRAGGVVVGEASNRVRYVAFGSITTIAGSGASGFLGDGGRAVDAQLNDPNGVAIDAAGGVLIADTGNHRIRRLDRDGAITTIAGGGFRSPADDNVPALESTLQFPFGVAVDHAGNIYIADSGNHVIRRVDPGGTITTVVGVARVSGFAGDGGPATSALLNFPVGVTVGRKGELFVADTRNNCVRHVGSKGKITSVAGQGDGRFGDFSGDGGPATDALLNTPQAVVLDADGSLLIADSFNGRVRRVDGDGIITTIAGGGTDTPVDDAPATTVRLGEPTSLAFDRAGGVIVGDEIDHRVWRLTPTGIVAPPHGA